MFFRSCMTYMYIAFVRLSGGIVPREIFFIYTDGEELQIFTYAPHSQSLSNEVIYFANDTGHPHLRSFAKTCDVHTCCRELDGETVGQTLLVL